MCVVIPRFSEHKPWRMASHSYLEKKLVRANWQVQICTGLINSLDSNVMYCDEAFSVINPYPTAFPYGNGMILNFYQQQESSTTKTVHKVINKGLKTYV